MVGAGVMARAHSVALHTLAVLYPDLGRHPRLVAVSDVNRSLATDLADRFGYERVEEDWRSVVSAADVDLVVACLPPVLNRDVVLAAAAAGKHIVCEKPLADLRRRGGRDAASLSERGRLPRPRRRLPLEPGTPGRSAA